MSQGDDRISNAELLKHLEQMQSDLDQLKSNIYNISQDDRKTIVKNIPVQPVILQQMPTYVDPVHERVSEYPLLLGSMPHLIKNSVFRPSYRINSKKGNSKVYRRSRRF